MSRYIRLYVLSSAGVCYGFFQQLDRAAPAPNKRYTINIKSVSVIMMCAGMRMLWSDRCAAPLADWAFVIAA